MTWGRGIGLHGVIEAGVGIRVSTRGSSDILLGLVFGEEVEDYSQGFYCK